MKPNKLIGLFSILLSGPQMHLCILFGLLWSSAVLGVQREAHGANKFALVIGINKYENQSVTNLEYAVRDAETIERLLIEELKYDPKDVRCLTNKMATRENILSQYYDLREKMNIDSEFILYFAGHGIRDMNVVVGQERESYWLTYKTNFATIETEGIRLRDIWRLVRKLPAHRKLIILDHCYAGDLVLQSSNEPQLGPSENTGSRNISSGSYSSRPSGKIRPERSPYEDKGQRDLINNVVLTAPPEIETIGLIAAARDEAYEHKILQHGLLTWAIEKALTSDKKAVDASNFDGHPSGTITLQELASYLKIITDKEKTRLADLARDEKLKNEYKKLEDIIEQQKLNFLIKNTNEAIRGWPLLEIALRADLDLALEFLEDLRRFGLSGYCYGFSKKPLELAKEQVQRNGEIAKDNCLGEAIINLLNTTKKELDSSGGLSRTDMPAVKDALLEGYEKAKIRCKK
jgi:hypothetical protein